MKSARILIELNRSSSIHQKIDFIFFRDSTRWYYHLHTLMEMRATAPSRSRRRRCSPKEIAWHRDRSKYRIYSLKYTHTHTHTTRKSIPPLRKFPTSLAPPRLASPRRTYQYRTKLPHSQIMRHESRLSIFSLRSQPRKRGEISVKRFHVIVYSDGDGPCPA